MEVKFLRVHPDAKMPTKGSRDAVGHDLYTAERISIAPGGFGLIRTGLVVQMPSFLEMQIRPRSGISKQFKNYVANSPGTIDPDYRGEILIMVVNNCTDTWMNMEKGSRIAQAVFNIIARPRIIEVDALSETRRGKDGFGSTGR
jgi:dUTP pyrophosphatase